MADDGVIKIGTAVDLSGLQQGMAEAASAVQSSAADMSESLDAVTASSMAFSEATEIESASLAELNEAYQSIEALGLEVAQAMDAVAEAAAAEAQAVSQAIAASSDTTESMSAAALATGQARAAFETMAATALEAADAQSRTNSILNQYREGVLNAGLATQLLAAQMSENSGVTTRYATVKREAAAAQAALTEAETRGANAANIDAAAETEAAAAKQASAAASFEAATAEEAETNALRSNISSRMAASAELRVLEGNFQGSTRAAGAFLSVLPGIGEAMQLAFPVFGALALVEVIGQAISKGEELREEYEKLSKVGDQIAKDWKHASDAIMLESDRLETSTDKALAEIDKLLKRPSDNLLKEAFDEARESADRLGLSIDNDLAKFQDLVNKKENTVGFWGGLFTQQATTGDSEKLLNDSANQIQGVENEYGGVVERAGQSGNAENLQQAQVARLNALQRVYDTVSANISKSLKVAQAAQDSYDASGQAFGHDHMANIKLLSGALKDLQEQERKIGLIYAEGQAKSEKTSTVKPPKDTRRDDVGISGMLKDDIANLEKTRIDSNLLAQTEEQGFKGATETLKLQTDAQKQAQQAALQAYNDNISLQKTQAEGAVQDAKDAFEATQQKIKSQEELGLISHRVAERQTLDAINLRDASIQGTLKKEQQLFDPAAGAQQLQEWTKLQNQMTAETNKASLQRDQAIAREAQTIKNDMDRAFDALNSGMKTAVNGMISGTKTASQAFSEMFESMIEATADFVLEYLLKKAEMWAEEQILDALGLTTKKTTQAAANLATVTGDAAVAAAGTMAYYSFSDPIAAPALAAAQFAMTMSYAGLAGFDTGTNFIPHDGVAMLHKGEAVMPASTAGEFRSAMSGGGKASGGNTLHYAPNVSGLDKSSFKSMLDDHSEHLFGMMRQGFREGRLN